MNSIVKNETQPPYFEADDEVKLAEYFDIIFDNRWLVLVIAFAFILLGGIYAYSARPIYESNLSVQVEDSEKSAGSFLGDAAASFLSVKTPAAGEIEIIKSRMILGKAVDNTKLYITARPRYVPIIGQRLSRGATALTEPGLLSSYGYVSGAERIVVPQFDVPNEYEGTRFVLTAKNSNEFEVSHPELPQPIMGRVGQLVTAKLGSSQVNLLVSSLDANADAKFELFRFSKQQTLASLQDELKVVEKGKQSGVIDVSWESADKEKLTQTLNEIGRLYVRQNIERKAEEVERTIGFLDTELPKFKRQLEQSEDVYNKYRNQNGTVSLDDEARNALSQTVDLQSKLVDVQQKRRELLFKFTDRHPAVQTIDAQISALNAEIGSVDARIRKMPMLQQSTLRMQRDIKVNTDLYVSLLNSSLQMRLAKEGKVGNVRLVDEAVTPELAVKPKKSLILAVALMLGILTGIVAAIAKSSFFGGIRNPAEIEVQTGLNVYSTIPLSDLQRVLDTKVEDKQAGLHVLAITNPEDPAIESLRSLRTALQFAMMEASNNRLLISGGTPGVGKTFVSVNFASIVAASGKRVLLIDADLRKGRVNQYFSVERKNGLSELIVGTRSLNEVLRRQIVPNLDIITTGTLPPNPGELLTSDLFGQVLDKASALYDLVIIDTAPVLVASDTTSVGPRAGTILLVARAEKTQLGELNESVKRLTHVGCSVNGVILNAMDLSRRHYGSYGYKYGGYKYTHYKYNNS